MVSQPAEPAIALISGGLDSATAAALGREKGLKVIGLSFDYGQRHRRELGTRSGVVTLLRRTARLMAHR